MLEIKPDTKIHNLLETYPQLEDFLIGLNKKYKKLKNPILRKTVARVATLSQVAKIGGYHTLDLVNMLREEVGQKPISRGDIEEPEESNEVPSWITNEPKLIIDANELLDSDKNPLAEVNKALKDLSDGEIILIKSDFLPSPLIDSFKEQGREVYSTKEDDSNFLTYIKK